jgi:hypothetical protein
MYILLYCYIIILIQGRTYAEGIREGGGPKGEQVTGVWRNLHDKNLRDLYASQNITRVIT